LKIESQQKLKDLFNEGCYVRISRRRSEGFVSDIFEDDFGLCYSNDWNRRCPLSDVREIDVRVFREVMDWTGVNLEQSI
jgi:hypothetical protein